MKRLKRALCMVLALLCCNLFAQEVNGLFYGEIVPPVSAARKAYALAVYRFDKNNYIFELDGVKSALFFTIPQKYVNADDYYEEKGTFKVISENALSYVAFASASAFRVKERLGLLYNPRKLCLYDKNELVFSSNEGLRWADSWAQIVKVETSSALQEKDKRYDGTNFIKPENNYLCPWVEGVSGDGLGEWIEITTKHRTFATEYFLVSNGYVDFTKPHLYKANGRVKKIRVECKTQGIDFVAALEDSPHFQKITLPKPVDADAATYRFTIIEVYPGEKWADTCLNLIIPSGDEPL